MIWNCSGGFPVLWMSVCTALGGCGEAKIRHLRFGTVRREQAMVMTVAGPPLTKFAGAAHPRRSIPGPGANAHEMVAGDDLTTWLVSPGVVDCAILTIVLVTTRPGGALIGRHRPGGAQAMAGGFIRAMAHFNPFSGPRAAEITKLFNSCLAGQTATVNDLRVAISFHTGAHRPSTNRLVTEVGQAVPALGSLTTHGYGVGSPQGKNTKPVTIYLSPTGVLSASQQ
jgi:hypothetical protein